MSEIKGGTEMNSPYTYKTGEMVYLKEDFESIKKGELVEVLQDVSYQPGENIFTKVKTLDGKEELLNITWLTRKQPKIATMNAYDELKNIIERKSGKDLFEMNEGEFEKYVGDATTFKNGTLTITESQSDIPVFGLPSLKSTAIGTMYQAMLVKYAKEVPEYMLTLEQYATIKFINSTMMEFSTMGGLAVFEESYQKEYDKMLEMNGKKDIPVTPSVSAQNKQPEYQQVGDDTVQFTDETFRWDIPKIEDIEKQGYVFSNMVTSNFHPYNTQRIAFEIDYKQSDLHFVYIGDSKIGVFFRKDAEKGYVSEAMLPGGEKDVKISTPSVLSTQKPKNATKQRHYIINAMFDRYRQGLKSNKTDIVRITTEAGVEDLNWAYEIVELSWVEWYRHMITRAKDAGKSIEEIMKEVWRFYETQQPTFTAMDSTKRIYQQYSTAAIISLLGGWFVDNGKAYKNMTVFEPSAGNGLLTIWFKREACWVNELDKTRNGNLALGIPLDLDKPNTLVHYNDVKNFDASNDLVFSHFDDTFDGILTNPPFGPLIKSDLRVKEIQVKLDEKMAQVALQTMKSNGRAAIVVGEHTEFTTEGVIRGRRPFYHWLYKNFNVVDMINIDSQKLYQKQGTIYPLRLILIAGKKEKAFGRAPFQKEQPQLSEIVQTPEALLARVAIAKEKALVPMITLNDLMKNEIKKLEIALDLL